MESAAIMQRSHVFAESSNHKPPDWVVHILLQAGARRISYWISSGDKNIFELFTDNLFSVYQDFAQSEPICSGRRASLVMLEHQYGMEFVFAQQTETN